MHDRFPVICHETNECGVPLIDDLREGSGTGRHENLSDPVVEVLDTLIGDSEECLSRPFLGRLLGKIPHPVLQRVLLSALSSDTRQDADLEAVHREEELRVVFGVYRHECVIPFDSGERTRQAVLHVPENGSTEVHVVLYETHSTVPRPTTPRWIADNLG